MSDWSSFPKQKHITDQWRDFLTEEGGYMAQIAPLIGGREAPEIKDLAPEQTALVVQGVNALEKVNTPEEVTALVKSEFFVELYKNNPEIYDLVMNSASKSNLDVTGQALANAMLKGNEPAVDAALKDLKVSRPDRAIHMLSLLTNFQSSSPGRDPLFQLDYAALAESTNPLNEVDQPRPKVGLPNISARGFYPQRPPGEQWAPDSSRVGKESPEWQRTDARQKFEKSMANRLQGLFKEAPKDYQKYVIARALIIYWETYVAQNPYNLNPELLQNARTVAQLQIKWINSNIDFGAVDKSRAKNQADLKKAAATPEIAGLLAPTSPGYSAEQEEKRGKTVNAMKNVFGGIMDVVGLVGFAGPGPAQAAAAAAAGASLANNLTYDPPRYAWALVDLAAIALAAVPVAAGAGGASKIALKAAKAASALKKIMKQGEVVVVGAKGAKAAKGLSVVKSELGEEAGNMVGWALTLKGEDGSYYVDPPLNKMISAATKHPDAQKRLLKLQQLVKDIQSSYTAPETSASRATADAAAAEEEASIAGGAGQGPGVGGLPREHNAPKRPLIKESQLENWQVLAGIKERVL